MRATWLKGRRAATGHRLTRRDGHMTGRVVLCLVRGALGYNSDKRLGMRGNRNPDLGTFVITEDPEQIRLEYLEYRYQPNLPFEEFYLV